MNGTNQYFINNLMRERDKIEDMIRNYQSVSMQQPNPINNFINTNQQTQDNLYDIKKLNDNDEVENILVTKNTIFLGSNKMQIKRLDGSIEKYSIERYYPIDEKDEMIKALNQKVEELEKRLNNEYTEFDGTTTKFNKSNDNDDELFKTKSKTSSKSTTK